MQEVDKLYAKKEAACRRRAMQIVRERELEKRRKEEEEKAQKAASPVRIGLGASPGIGLGASPGIGLSGKGIGLGVGAAPGAASLNNTLERATPDALNASASISPGKLGITTQKNPVLGLGGAADAAYVSKEDPFQQQQQTAVGAEPEVQLDEVQVNAELQAILSVSPEITEMLKEKHRINLEIERVREPSDAEIYKKVTQLVLGAHTVTQKKLVAAESEPG